MKQILPLLCILLITGISLTAQVTLLNLTSPDKASADVFLGIQNLFLVRGGESELHLSAENARVRLSGDSLIVKPIMKGRVVLRYHTTTDSGQLVLNSIFLPAPVPVFVKQFFPQREYKVMTHKSTETKITGSAVLKISSSSGPDMYAARTVESFQVTYKNQVHHVKGNILPAGLIPIEADNDQLIVENIRLQGEQAPEIQSIAGRFKYPAAELLNGQLTAPVKN